MWGCQYIWLSSFSGSCGHCQTQGWGQTLSLTLDLKKYHLFHGSHDITFYKHSRHCHNVVFVIATVTNSLQAVPILSFSWESWQTIIRQLFQSPVSSLSWQTALKPTGNTRQTVIGKPNTKIRLNFFPNGGKGVHTEAYIFTMAPTLVGSWSSRHPNGVPQPFTLTDKNKHVCHVLQVLWIRARGLCCVGPCCRLQL